MPMLSWSLLRFPFALLLPPIRSFRPIAILSPLGSSALAIPTGQVQVGFWLLLLCSVALDSFAFSIFRAKDKEKQKARIDGGGKAAEDGIHNGTVGTAENAIRAQSLPDGEETAGIGTRIGTE